MVRVAFLSGGKDSLYAAMQRWPPDYGVILVYEFPRPSPHLINLGKSIETLLLTGISVVAKKLPRGREREETIKLLKRLKASELVAGDVYVEEHLKYVEGIAEEVGARLYEPLWGMDPEELLYREIESGLTALITGADKRLGNWVGRVLDKESAGELASEAKRLGLDPLGEQGEYHTLVINSPVHAERLDYRICGRFEHESGYVLLRVC
ncbi:MAG: ATPase [Pyrodictiaceae archaeon]